MTFNDLVDRGIKKAQTASAFMTTLVPFHTHNGVDSSKIKYKDLIGLPTQNSTYGGSVSGASGAAIMLPTGWTSAKINPGSYTVTHNLGVTNYVVVANPLSTNPIADSCYATVQEPMDPTMFTVQFTNDTGSTTAINTDFNFVLFIQT